MALKIWVDQKQSLSQKEMEESAGIYFKKIDYLVVGDSKPTKKKIDQAKELKIKIMLEKDWNKILNSWTSFFKF